MIYINRTHLQCTKEMVNAESFTATTTIGAGASGRSVWFKKAARFGLGR